MLLNRISPHFRRLSRFRLRHRRRRSSNPTPELFFIMKPNEVVTRSFRLYPTTDQAAKYVCVAILKDSDFHEIDRAECQFTTTSTVLDNGTQIPFQPPKNKGFFESIEELWLELWHSMVDFVTGQTCRMKCSHFFDIHCHIRYICMNWLLMFGLFSAIFPTVIVLLWLLHQNGVFDPFYDWWEDHFWDEERKIQHIRKHQKIVWEDHPKKHHKKLRHHTGSHKRQKSIYKEHRHDHSERDDDYYYNLHHVKRDKHKHGRVKSSSIVQPLYVDSGEQEIVGERRKRNYGRTK